MNNSNYLQEIQKRLPDDIVIKNQSVFEFSDDEFIAILSWIKIFNKHYKLYGKTKQFDLIFALISKRLYLDFGLYKVPNDTDENKGAFIIYISDCHKQNNKGASIKKLISTWQL